jgi:hypothetical protein
MLAKTIKESPEYYITDTGAFYSRKQYNNPKGRIKKLFPCVDNVGYFSAAIRVNGKLKKKRIHVLVAEAFLKKKPDSQCVNHKDGNKLNNNVDNLEWCTYKQNNQHAREVLKVKIYGKPVIQLKNGKKINVFASSLDAERKTGISASGIRHCISGVSKHAGGYTWKHKEQ